jgi:hypothetical protein
MSSLTVSCIVFGCVFGGVLLGMLLRAILPEKHLSTETKGLVQLGMGLIGTMTALVLGLMIASAKSSFDTQRNGLAQLSGNIIFLDRILRRYGDESNDAREYLRASVADMLERTWPSEYPRPDRTEAKSGTEGRYEALYDKIEGLTPRNESQRALQAQALKIAGDTAQARWLLFAQKGGSIPTPFLVVMVSWLTLLFMSFSMFAPRNVTVFFALLICALAVSSAIFLILELDRPFGGIIQISSEPLRNALHQLELGE